MKNQFDRDLTDKILEYGNKNFNKIGRYSISAMWGIVNNYTTPEQYLKGEKKGIEDIWRMEKGTLYHQFLDKFAEGETEIKKEYDCGEFVIVGKCDELTDNEVIEYKTSDKVYQEAKSWHRYQVKMYLSVFERDFGIIYQPVIREGRFILKTLGTCKRNDDWFMEQIEKLKVFHNKLKQYE